MKPMFIIILVVAVVVALFMLSTTGALRVPLLTNELKAYVINDDDEVSALNEPMIGNTNPTTVGYGKVHIQFLWKLAGTYGDVKEGGVIYWTLTTDSGVSVDQGEVSSDHYSQNPVAFINLGLGVGHYKLHAVGTVDGAQVIESPTYFVDVVSQTATRQTQSWPYQDGVIDQGEALAMSAYWQYWSSGQQQWVNVDGDCIVYQLHTAGDASDIMFEVSRACGPVTINDMRSVPAGSYWLEIFTTYPASGVYEPQSTMFEIEVL
jgi:hypothetical protein